MIIDRIENAYKYYCLGEEFEKAFKFLEDGGLAKLALGRHELGNGTYASIDEYNGKLPENSLAEFHELYTDIQYVISGRERIGFAPAKEGKSEDFDSKKDVGFVRSEMEYITLHEGMFAVLYPKELHQPGISTDGSCSLIRKVVVKVKCARRRE